MPEYTVPVVFDIVVCAAQDDRCELRPSVLRLSLHVEQDPVFFDTPLELVEKWVELVAPALSTLLSCASWDLLCDCVP